MPQTITQALLNNQTLLAQALQLEKIEARIEAQALLSHTLGVSKAYLIAHRDEPLNPLQENQFQTLVAQRLKGEPIAYILGEREFYSLPFKVTPAVLIPRPETELLVELALAHIPQNTPLRILDLGTGSGAVAITLAKHRPLASVTAIDQSLEALNVARDNAARLATTNITFLQSDWYQSVKHQIFDIIVSNPPYIAKNDIHLRQGDLRFEPISALASGIDGLTDIHTIVNGAKTHLSPGGWLLFEHGYDQAEACKALLDLHGFIHAESVNDLAKIPRVTLGKTP
ncbi:peptide chain release factor N(5)-glutamine methyltransferase [Sulfurirhabdus autotrophica]|uniref:Release factor glutamine methyltransferase n=1 Tax=Sulfurirhabdus autotrophica TaxID=1706046 RepID=A0A4R3XWN5_9PROT|nr:peptide chain release factor N(5)-glutamine methyltransferase [Sulfurirhabdus autotrophica]TCV84155.1 [protein release factor]-glutamine N5-methyltransferase [Sulfurirhabdus autotrophica]